MGSSHSHTSYTVETSYGGVDPSSVHSLTNRSSTLADQAEASRPILPQQKPEEYDYSFHCDEVEDEDDDDVRYIFDDAGSHTGGEDDDSWEHSHSNNPYASGKSSSSPPSKKHEWLLRMNRKLQEVPVGQLDPGTVPLSAVMNAWAKSKSAQGASMVEMWLKRAQQEFNHGNTRVVPTTKMYTMA